MILHLYTKATPRTEYVALRNPITVICSCGATSKIWRLGKTYHALTEGWTFTKHGWTCGGEGHEQLAFFGWPEGTNPQCATNLR